MPTISGTVTVEGVPAERKVVLYRKSNGEEVLSTYSDPTTGAYSFTTVDTDTYFAIAYDGVLVKPGYGWVETDRLVPELFNVPFSNTFNIQFGGSLSFDSSETVMAVGATHARASWRGRVYIFRKIGGVWTYDTYIDPPNTTVDDGFGHGVYFAPDGLRLMVTSYLGAGNYGLFTYRYQTGTWTLVNNLTTMPAVANYTSTNTYFNSCGVSRNGLVFARGDNDLIYMGASGPRGGVYIFDWNDAGNTWDFRYLVENPIPSVYQGADDDSLFGGSYRHGSQLNADGTVLVTKSYRAGVWDANLNGGEFPYLQNIHTFTLGPSSYAVQAHLLGDAYGNMPYEFGFFFNPTEPDRYYFSASAYIPRLYYATLTGGVFGPLTRDTSVPYPEYWFQNPATNALKFRFNDQNPAYAEDGNRYDDVGNGSNEATKYFASDGTLWVGAPAWMQGWGTSNRNGAVCQFTYMLRPNIWTPGNRRELVHDNLVPV